MSAPVRTTSLQSPSFTLFGKNDPNSANFGNILILSNKPWGDSMAKKPLMRSATSSSLPTSNANSIRRTLPNVFTSSGTREPFGFSNSNAGPTLLALRLASRATRWVISVISRTGSTSVRTRVSSPSFSSLRTNSRKSRYATLSS